MHEQMVPDTIFLLRARDDRGPGGHRLLPKIVPGSERNTKLTWLVEL